MLFKPEHENMIRNGVKTATRRLWKRWGAKEGGTYPVQTKMYKPKVECPIIKCTKRYLQPLGEMTEDDADKEGGFTLEQFKQRWREIYGVPFDPNQIAHVVEFEYIGEGSELYGIVGRFR